MSGKHHITINEIETIVDKIFFDAISLFTKTKNKIVSTKIPNTIPKSNIL